MSYAIYLYCEERGDEGWGFAGTVGPLVDMGLSGPPPDVQPKPCYWSGDYNLMAVLVGFRNPPAGWTAPFAPFASPRGLPPDLSPVLTAWTRYVAPDSYHSPGWFTLAEALAFPWMGLRNHWVGALCSPQLEGEDEVVTYAGIAHEFLDQVVRMKYDVGAPANVRFVYWIA